MRNALWVILGLMLLCGCPPKPNGSVGNIISHQEDGSADDAAAPPTKYPPGLNAVDGQTNASSIVPASNKVGGAVHAIPGNPAVRDVATAISNNKVFSSFVVTKADTFNFDLSLDLQGPAVTGKGKLTLQLTADVSDLQGKTPNGPNGKPIPPIHSGAYSVEQDAQGKQQVKEPGGKLQPVDAKGNYSGKPATNPVTLPPGNYQLRLELTMIATAPPGQGTALLDNATATITLK